jgi:hypothetical protein
MDYLRPSKEVARHAIGRALLPRTLVLGSRLKGPAATATAAVGAGKDWQTTTTDVAAATVKVAILGSARSSGSLTSLRDSPLLAECIIRPVALHLPPSLSLSRDKYSTR